MTDEPIAETEALHRMPLAPLTGYVKPEPPFPNDMKRDELRRWLRYAGWEMFEPDGWWNYRHMMNMKTGGIIHEPPNRVLQRLAAKTKHRLMAAASHNN